MCDKDCPVWEPVENPKCLVCRDEGFIQFVTGSGIDDDGIPYTNVHVGECPEGCINRYAAAKK